MIYPDTRVKEPFDTATAVLWSAEREPKPVTVLDQIGDTPLIDLSQFAHRNGVGKGVKVLAKAEWFNPGGSVKARAALQIVREGEQNGELTPGKTIIDSSSGNTGIALALIGAVKGYPVELVMPSNVSAERKALVRAYGASLIETDPLGGSDEAILIVRKRVEANPERYFYANQYNNPANWRAHYQTTGPEIWRQTNGQVTHFVTGLGTSGTLIGIGRYLKQRNPDIQVLAIQPEDELEVIEGLKHLATAIVPDIYDDGVPDQQITIDAETTWNMTRRLAQEAGIFVGLSAGAAVASAINVAVGLTDGVIVTVLPDDGSKYVSLGIFD